MGPSAEGAAPRSKYFFKAAATAAAPPILGEKFLLLGLATGQGLSPAGGLQVLETYPKDRECESECH